MLEPTLRYGLARSTLDLYVCHDGNLIVRHAGTGQEWEWEVITKREAVGMVKVAEMVDAEEARMREGRDYGDEHPGGGGGGAD